MSLPLPLHGHFTLTFSLCNVIGCRVFQKPISKCVHKTRESPRETPPNNNYKKIYIFIYYYFFFFTGTYNTQKALTCKEDGNCNLSCVFAQGSRVKGCIYVFRRLDDTSRRLPPVYIRTGEQRTYKLEEGWYNILVYDWEVGWKRYGHALNLSIVDIKPKSKCVIVMLFMSVMIVIPSYTQATTA